MPLIYMCVCVCQKRKICMTNIFQGRFTPLEIKLKDQSSLLNKSFSKLDHMNKPNLKISKD